ncbi:hypothetical protein [Oceanibaculum nanhaiense]|uniref:hypothetical protein n=1 Tax=Oceanibaculum nanhaiense TaxID=1909734 RepID=UPI003D281CC8
MKPHCFFTSFNKAYLPQALLLAESLRHVYGGKAILVAILVDELTAEDRPGFEAFSRTIEASALGIPNFHSWIFGLDVVEAATAVKPFALSALLREYQQVTYLDPDTYLFSPLAEIEAMDSAFDAVVTPHQIYPQREKWLVESTELESMRYGVFNLGFLSVRSSTGGREIADWWARRCYSYCVVDFPNGLFTDQKLFDLAPALFPGLRVLRHPGYNLATWNLRERRVAFSSSEGPTVDGQPLRFCHFTKASHIGNEAMERMISEESAFFQELFYSYVARLRGRRLQLSQMNADWAYGRYRGGPWIAGETRQAFRKLGEKRFAIENPFEAQEAVERMIAGAA